ncbi:hydroxypyruvate isomerase family protein [Salegentibacter sp.]|uniref:hydroxypyruvate isomerase family protein n=1 Tax=Salegentibacter sp. TaxID=1903072 RepID=UPI003569DABB
MSDRYSRRDALKTMVLGSGLLSIGGVVSSFAAINLIDKHEAGKNSRKIKHSVCRWCFEDIPLNKFAEQCAALGFDAIDLLKPSEWETVERHGLVCAMATDDFASVENGFNQPKNHKSLQGNYRRLIDRASKHEIENVIVFSGNRRGMDDKTGISNCITGLRPLLKYAESKNINLVMELLNSKIDYPDYMCDSTDWGVALAEEIDAPNFKLLYNVYHMQVMEGDIIGTIKKHHKHFNHYHAAGAPGRNEINDSQEINYPAIMKAIVETGFDGYVGQEFIPTYDNKMAALQEAIKICDV